RSSHDPETSGKISIYAPHYTVCSQDPPYECGIHVPLIEFRNYRFNSSSDEHNITLYLVTENKKRKDEPVLEFLPNPVASELTISGTAQGTFIITSVEGIIVKRGISCNTEIDLSGLKPGVYIVQTEKGRFAGKIIKL